jgi:ketohexokinase
VDTVGAGDTFIAGMLYACVHQRTWGAQERLKFANELAGRKVHQRGFKGLGAAMRRSDVWKMKLAESALS